MKCVFLLEKISDCDVVVVNRQKVDKVNKECYLAIMEKVADDKDIELDILTTDDILYSSYYGADSEEYKVIDVDLGYCEVLDMERNEILAIPTQDVIQSIYPI